MIGNYILRIKDKHIAYKIDLKRKFTQIKGKSATGKTYLAILIQRYKLEIANNSNVNVSVLPTEKHLYIPVLKETKNNVYLIDEQTEEILSGEFASLLYNSDNYFVFLTRENLKNLPISVREVYKLELYFENNFKINKNVAYDGFSYVDFALSNCLDRINLIFTEDSKSGYQFFNKYFKDIKCVSCKDNSRVLSTLLQYNKPDNYAAVIVDGAAFASYLEDVLNFTKYNKTYLVYVPESFEFLLLNSNMLDDIVDKDVIEHSENYCDNNVFKEKFNPKFDIFNKNYSLISWERLYTAYLKYITSNDDLRHYNKSSLNNYYLKSGEQIINQLR